MAHYFEDVYFSGNSLDVVYVIDFPLVKYFYCYFLTCINMKSLFNFAECSLTKSFLNLIISDNLGSNIDFTVWFLRHFNFGNPAAFIDILEISIFTLILTFNLRGGFLATFDWRICRCNDSAIAVDPSALTVFHKQARQLTVLLQKEHVLQVVLYLEALVVLQLTLKYGNIRRHWCSYMSLAPLLSVYRIDNFDETCVYGVSVVLINLLQVFAFTVDNGLSVLKALEH